MQQRKQKLVKPATYAKMRGLNRSTVSRQIESGQIHTVNGLIDPGVADLGRQGNLDPARRTDETGDEKFSDAKARKESALADLRQLEYWKKSGALIEVAKVELEWTDIAAKIQTGVLGIPARIVNRIPAEYRREVLTVAQDEVRQVLTSLADKIRGGKKPKKTAA